MKQKLTVKGGKREKKSWKTELWFLLWSLLPIHGFEDLHKHKILQFISLAQSLFQTPASCIQRPTWWLKPNRPSAQLQVSPPNLATSIAFLISDDGSSSFQFLSPNALSHSCPFLTTPLGNDASVICVSWRAPTTDFYYGFLKVIVSAYFGRFFESMKCLYSFLYSSGPTTVFYTF